MRSLFAGFLVLGTLAAAEPHWAFVPPKRSPGGCVDNLLPAKCPDADRRTLLRRVSFDLTGLPPTLDELVAFLKDDSVNAYEKVVDRLLASPHFGERQAQHWLDAVRFAETNGYELDGDRPHAWRYRDYVVKSFNDDKPYDRFLLEQIAGDELYENEKNTELLIATGMHRCGPIHMVSGNLDREAVRRERLNETLTGFGAAVLGLTVSCARCHDHKFDPLTQADYYSLEAFFAGTLEKDLDIATATEKRKYNAEHEAIIEALTPLKKRLESLEKPYREKLAKEKRAALSADLRTALDTPAKDRTPAQVQQARDANILIKVLWDELLASFSPEDRATREKLKATTRDLQARLPPPPAKAWSITADKSAPDTHVLKRGDMHRKLQKVSAAVPAVFESKSPFANRRELSAWLTNPQHPLTARVIVNRLWQQYFGQGIVGTPTDFGTRGDKPSHPKLLDWLALELSQPQNGEKPWSLKRIHKLIVMSKGYRAADRPRRRLDAEALRDAILVASGTLNHTVGGRSIRVPLEPEVYDLIFTEDEPDNLWSVTPDKAQHTRRSLYLLNKRNVRQPILEAFDQPDTLTPCTKRGISTFAPQALILMNGSLSREQAKVLALLAQKQPDPIVAIYQRCLLREPTAGERALATKFLESSPLEDFVLAVFNLNEFAYIP